MLSCRVSLRDEFDFWVRHAWMNTKGENLHIARRSQYLLHASLDWEQSWDVKATSNFSLRKMCLCPEEFSFRRLKLSHPYASAFATSPVSATEYSSENVQNMHGMIREDFWFNSSYTEVEVIVEVYTRMFAANLVIGQNEHTCGENYFKGTDFQAEEHREFVVIRTYYSYYSRLRVMVTKG